MRRVQIGNPVGQDGTLDWLVQAMREIEQASEQENPFEVFDGLTIVNPPAIPVRTLNVTTATAGDVAAFLATLVIDMQRRGPGRVE